MTSRSASENATTFMQHRVSDSTVKPSSPGNLVAPVASVQGIPERDGSTTELGDRRSVPRLLGQSLAASRLREQVQVFGASAASVLITGEIGTGKHLVARALHAASSRRYGPFVALDVDSFAKAILDSETPGQMRGTSAEAVKPCGGHVEAAQGGTLVVDDVGELPIPAQARLLNLLQEPSSHLQTEDGASELSIRLLCASKKPLLELVDAGRFRRDLYCRISALHIELPPLRERRDDLPLLVAHFAKSTSGDSVPPGIQQEILKVLGAYDFPGNVRELEVTIQHAVIRARSEGAQQLRIRHLPRAIRERTARPSGLAPHRIEPLSIEPLSIEPLSTAVKAFERQHVLEALSRCRGHRTMTARMLGISRKNLWEKLRNHGISNEDVIRVAARGSGGNHDV